MTPLERSLGLKRTGGPKRKKKTKARCPQCLNSPDVTMCGACGRGVVRRSGPCAVCGTPWSEADPHHIIEQQELKRRRLHHLLLDERNIMLLCPIFWSSYSGRGERCHERHTNASRRIPLAALTEDNWSFAREVLGEAADDYLTRRYSDA